MSDESIASSDSTDLRPERSRLHHLVNVVGVELPLPHEIIPGHRLVRASYRQARGIRQFVQSDRSGRDWPIVPYEMVRSPDLDDGQWREVPPEEWRYFGIDAPETSRLVDDLELAGELVGTDLFHLGVGVTLLESAGTLATGRGDQLKRPRAYRRDGVLTAREVESIVRVHAKLSAHDNSLVNLRRALHEMRELREMDPDSKLRFLGYFAVLESVVTHHPKPSDPYDAITRQVIGKMTLIANEMNVSGEWASRFGGAGPESVWKAMYAYRSAIAHGATFAFKGKEGILKNQAHALSFLVTATTTLLRFGLEHPVLLRDLKAC